MTEASQYQIIHRGVSYRINPALVRMRGIGPETLEAIKAKHREIIDLRFLATQSPDKAEMNRISATVERCEFELQDLWGFPRDVARHSHWLFIPGCTCPTAPNKVLWGHPVRLVSKDCPVFGDAERDDITLVRTDGSEPPRTIHDLPA